MPPVDLVKLASAYWRSSALTAAVELGIFEALAQNSASPEALGRSLECSLPHLEALLDALCGMGVLEKSGNLYGIPASQSPYLDPGSPDCMLDAFRFNRDLAGLWMRLPECVREGTPAMPNNPHLGEDPERTRRFVRGMHSRAGIMARGLLPHVVPEPGSRLLDVGGGPGTFSMKLAERDPSLEVTVLDLPPVAAAAREIHAGNPALERVRFRGGDYHEADYPKEVDMLLYCGALHQEPEEVAPDLFRKMYEALKPGGRLVVVDLMLDADRATPSYSALFQLNMMLMRPASRVYTSKRLKELLREVGFASPEEVEVAGTPYRLVRAARPGDAG